MNDFVRRNMPVLVIGLVTLVIFVGIIVAAQTRSGPTPTLETAEEHVLVTENAHFLGDENAPITIVEFSDLQCPGCAAITPVLESYARKNPEKVKLVYRHFPLNIHPRARFAAEASEAAAQQGKFWEYINVVFENQQNVERSDFIRYAEQINLNVEQFTRDLDSGTFAEKVTLDLQTATELGLNSTPTIYVNGEKLAYQNLFEVQTQIEEIISQYTDDQESPESSQ